MAGFKSRTKNLYSCSDAQSNAAPVGLLKPVYSKHCTLAALNYARCGRQRCAVLSVLPVAVSLSEQGHHALRPGDSRALSGSRHCCYPVLPAQTSVPHTTLLLLLSTWWPSQVSHSVIILERPRRRTLVIRFECIVQEAFKYLFAFYSQIPMCL